MNHQESLNTISRAIQEADQVLDQLKISAEESTHMQQEISTIASEYKSKIIEAITQIILLRDDPVSYLMRDNNAPPENRQLQDGQQ